MADVRDPSWQKPAALDPALVRHAWRVTEPLHGMIYFVPEAHERYAALGIAQSAGYFASRAARAVDTLLVAGAGTIGWLGGMLLGLPIRWNVMLAAMVAVAYEPALALAGGTRGKRLLRIEAISTWDCRPLAVSDVLRRAVVADLQLIPPVAVYNLAWLLWDPARQCLMAGRLACEGASGMRALGPGECRLAEGLVGTAVRNAAAVG